MEINFTTQKNSKSNKRKTPFEIQNYVSILISTNNELQRFVSSEKDTLEARCFTYRFTQKMYNYNFCNDNHIFFVAEPNTPMENTQPESTSKRL